MQKSKFIKRSVAFTYSQAAEIERQAERQEITFAEAHRQALQFWLEWRDTPPEAGAIKARRG